MPPVTSLNELRKKSRVVKGRWELGPGHRLAYRRDEDSRLEELDFETSLIAVEPEALVFALSGRQKNGRMVTQTARLEGRWQANDQNQLEFSVERASGTNDTLTFTGTWKLGPSQEILYTWRQRALKRKTARLHTLVFKGWWGLSEKHRLTYTLEGSSDASFEFRGAFQTHSILAKEGELRYRLGAGLSGKGKRRTLVIFGTWKISNKLELSFEMEYGPGKKREIRFGSEFQLGKGTTIAAHLTSQSGDPLGVELLFTRKFFSGNAEAFVRLKKSLKESALEAGARIAW